MESFNLRMTGNLYFAAVIRHNEEETGTVFLYMEESCSSSEEEFLQEVSWDGWDRGINDTLTLKSRVVSVFR